MKKILSLVLLASYFTVYAAADEAFINKGKTFLQSLYNKHPKTQATAIDDLEAIIATLHFLYSYVPDKNGGYDFSSGTIVLEDKDWTLWNFMVEYVRKLFDGDMCKEIWITLKKAYPRRSTHFNNYYLYMGRAKKKGLLVKKTDCEFVHYGIDPRKDQPLPVENKHHILFGKIGIIDGKPLMFIKFEEFGLRGKDAFLHMISLIKQKIQNKLAEITEKIRVKHTIAMPTSIELQESLDECIDSLSADISLKKYRRETIPVSVMGEYQALLLSPESALSKQDIATHKATAKALGIKDIVSTAETYAQSKHGTPLWREIMKNFAEEIKKQYPNDWHIRFGNEVIIFHEELIGQEEKETKPSIEK